MVLGLSDEPAEKVEPYVADNDVGLRVAADCNSGSEYMKWAGVNGIPHSFLIDPKGNIMWHGHPAELTEGKIKEALKGARKSTGDAALQLNLGIDAPGKASKLVELAADGSLAKALQEATAIGADTRASEAEKAAALEVSGKIEAHVADVLGQIDGFLERRDVLPARDALQVLSREFKGLPLAAGIVDREKKLVEDPALSKELAASEELHSILQAAAKRGLDKAKDKLDAFAKKNAGTRAGDKARKLVVRL